MNREAVISKSKSESAKGAEKSAVQWRPWLDEPTEKIIGAAIEAGFQRQAQLPVLYKAVRLDAGLKMDVVVPDAVVLELKTVERLLPFHSAQLLTYLELSGKSVGLLMNFNEPVLRKGRRRPVNHYSESATRRLSASAVK